MSANANSSTERSPQAQAALLITGLFVAAAILIITLVALHENYLAIYEQELSEQQAITESPLLKELRSREAALLDTTVVIDSAADKYRIPIERAIELIALDTNK